TVVRIGANSPRISAGWFGLGSRVSRWLMPPFRKMRIQLSAGRCPLPPIAKGGRGGGAAAEERRRRKFPREKQAAANEVWARNWRRVARSGGRVPMVPMGWPPGRISPHDTTGRAAVTFFFPGRISRKERFQGQKGAAGSPAAD